MIFLVRQFLLSGFNERPGYEDLSDGNLLLWGVSTIADIIERVPLEQVLHHAGPV